MWRTYFPTSARSARDRTRLFSTFLSCRTSILEYTLFQGPHYTGQLFVYLHLTIQRGCRGRDHMVVVFTTNYANKRCEFEPAQMRCQWLATGRWCSPGTPVSPTNKTDRRDRNEILLKVELNTINPIQTIYIQQFNK